MLHTPLNLTPVTVRLALYNLSLSFPVCNELIMNSPSTMTTLSLFIHAIRYNAYNTLLIRFYSAWIPTEKWGTHRDQGVNHVKGAKWIDLIILMMVIYSTNGGSAFATDSVLGKDVGSNSELRVQCSLNSICRGKYMYIGTISWIFCVCLPNCSMNQHS